MPCCWDHPPQPHMWQCHRDIQPKEKYLMVLPVLKKKDFGTKTDHLENLLTP